MSDTQTILHALETLLESEDRADIYLLVQAALRATEVTSSYEHAKIAVSILTIPDEESEEETDA